MGGGSGGSGSGGRKSGGGAGSGDAGQPGEVVRSAEEAKLQARVDNMNQLMGKLDKSIKAKDVSLAKMKSDFANANTRDYSKRNAQIALKDNIRKTEKAQNIERKRLLNINKRFEKILADNS